MKKTILILAFVFAWTTTALAFDMVLPVPPGGMSGRTATLLSDILKENNITSDIEYNQNCTVVKSKIENNNPENLIYLNTAQGLYDESCKLVIDGKKIKIIDELYTYTYGVCYRKDKKELGLDHFLNPTIRKNIATTIVTNNILANITNKLPKNNFNLVVVGNSGKTREVILGNEFDYAVVDSDWIGKNFDKVDCVFIGSDVDQEINGKKIINIKSLVEKTNPNAKNIPVLQDVFVLVGVNLDSNTEQTLVKQLDLIRNSDKWKELTKRFGNSNVTSKDKKFETITENLKN